MSSTVKTSFLLALALCSFGTINAQLRITGSVRDLSGTPLPFSTIRWKKDMNSLPTRFVVTDSAGRFSIDIPDSHGAWLQASALGYLPSETMVDSVRSEQQWMPILTPGSEALENVFIRNRPSVEISGDTTSFDVSKLKRGNENSISDLLANMPGFTRSNSGRLSYNGRLINRILLNGDDLSGNDYQYLLNNLDVGGIDRMQVIQHYSSQTDILSSLTNGTEQVLNIEFQKDFLHRIFGYVNAATSTKLTRGEAGSQVLALYKKFKILWLQQYNSTGKKIGDSDDMDLGQGSAFSYDLNFFRDKPLAAIETERFSIAPFQDLVRNRSGWSSLQSIYKASKVLTARMRLEGLLDKPTYQSSTSIDYFIDQSTVRIDQRLRTMQRLRQVSGTAGLDFRFNPRTQLLIAVKMANAHHLDSAGGFLFNDERNSQLLEYPRRQTGARIAFNRFLRKQYAFSITAEWKRDHFNNDFLFAPPSPQRFLFSSLLYDSLLQYEQHHLSSILAEARLMRKIRLNMWTLSLRQQQLRGDINNTIDLAYQGTRNRVPEDSLNNHLTTKNISTAALSYLWSVSAKLLFTGSADLSWIQYRQQNRALSQDQVSSGLHLFPKMNLQYVLSNTRQINFIAFSRAAFLEPRYLGTGIAISGMTSLIRNQNAMLTGKSKSVQLNFTDNALATNHRLFFASLSFTQLPLYYLSSVIPFGKYNYFLSQSTRSGFSSLNLLFTGQKLSKDFKTRLSPGLALSRSYSYRLQHAKELRVIFNQAQVSLNAETQLNKLQIKLKNQYTITNQNADVDVINHQLLSGLSVNYAFTKRLFFDIGSNYYLLKAYRQPSNDILLLNARLQLKSKNDRWDFGIDGNNLTNRETYARSFVTPLSVTTTAYDLFPGTVLAFVKWRFN